MPAIGNQIHTAQPAVCSCRRAVRSRLWWRKGRKREEKRRRGVGGEYTTLSNQTRLGFALGQIDLRRLSGSHPIDQLGLISSGSFRVLIYARHDAPCVCGPLPAILRAETIGTNLRSALPMMLCMDAYTGRERQDDMQFSSLLIFMPCRLVQTSCPYLFEGLQYGEGTNITIRIQSRSAASNNVNAVSHAIN